MTVPSLVRFGLTALLIAGVAAWAWFATRGDPVVVAVAAAETGRVETTIANTRAGSVSACRCARATE